MPDESWNSNGNGTYSVSYTTTDSLVDNGYDENFPIYIDKTLDPVKNRVTREDRLTKVASDAACISTVGSYYVVGAGTNWTMMIHPPDEAAPGVRYTYEVLDRYNNATFFHYNRDASLRGLRLSGASFGYGPLAGPRDFLGDRIDILHPGTHGCVFQGGELRRFLCYGKGNPTLAAITAYTADGTGQHAVIRDGYILGTDSGSAIYGHSSNDGTAWESILCENIAIVSRGRAPSGALPPAGGAGAINTKNFIVRGLFIHGYAYGVTPSHVFGETRVERSFMRNIARNRSATHFRDNVCFYENWADATNVNRRGAIIMEMAANHAVENNFFYVKHTDFGVANDNSCTMLVGTANMAMPNNCKFKRNIVVIDAGFANFSWTNGLIAGWSGIEVDENLYVLVSGVTSVAGTHFSAPFNKNFEEWKAATGFDANSMFIDARDDPRGVRAVFERTAYGGVDLAHTYLGGKAGEFMLAHNVGAPVYPDYFPIIPTADEVSLMLDRL